MNIKEFFMKKKAGTYINLAVLVLSVVSFITYLAYATSADGLMMPWVVVLLVVAIAAEVALLFFDNDYIPMAVPALLMIAFGCFAYDPPTTLGSIVDYFQNIVMFGNPDNFGIIVCNLVFMLAASVTAIVAVFFERVKK